MNFRSGVFYMLTRGLHWFDRRPRSAADYRPDAVRRILLVSSTALGDGVLSTAAMVAVRRQFPLARIGALVDRPYVPLFRIMPFLDEVLPYGGVLATGWAMRRFAPDLVLILHGNEPEATPLAYLSGAPFIFKLPNANDFRFLLSNSEPVLRWADLGHGLYQRLQTAALAGVNVTAAAMQLPVTETARVRVAHWLREAGINGTQPLIGFQLGASRRSRMWPVEHFVELARLISIQWPGSCYLLLGSPDESALCQLAQSALTAIGAPVISTAGQFPIEVLPALVSRLDVLVTGDTGTMHVAVAVGTPVVALFAVSDPNTSGPAQDSERHVVIHRPASDLGIGSKSDDSRGMARISPEEVVHGVARILGRGDEHGQRR